MNSRPDTQTLTGFENLADETRTNINDELSQYHYDEKLGFRLTDTIYAKKPKDSDTNYLVYSITDSSEKTTNISDLKQNLYKSAKNRKEIFPKDEFNAKFLTMADKDAFTNQSIELNAEKKKRRGKKGKGKKGPQPQKLYLTKEHLLEFLALYSLDTLKEQKRQAKKNNPGISDVDKSLTDDVYPEIVRPTQLIPPKNAEFELTADGQYYICKVADVNKKESDKNLLSIKRRMVERAKTVIENTDELYSVDRSSLTIKIDAAEYENVTQLWIDANNKKDNGKGAHIKNLSKLQEKLTKNKARRTEILEKNKPLESDIKVAAHDKPELEEDALQPAKKPKNTTNWCNLFPAPLNEHETKTVDVVSETKTMDAVSGTKTTDEVSETETDEVSEENLPSLFPVLEHYLS